MEKVFYYLFGERVMSGIKKVIKQIKSNIAFQQNTLNEILNSGREDEFRYEVTRLKGEISGMKYAIRCLKALKLKEKVSKPRADEWYRQLKLGDRVFFRGYDNLSSNKLELGTVEYIEYSQNKLPFVYFRGDKGTYDQFVSPTGGNLGQLFPYTEEIVAEYQLQTNIGEKE